MARASTVIGLTMLGAAGVGAATIPFMGSNSASGSGAQGIAGGGLRCEAHRFPTAAECQAAGHAVCRPDGTNFVPANCSTGTGSGTSGTRWYNSHPIYWFGGGRGGTTTTGSGTPQTLTTTTRTGGSGGPTTTTTGGGTSARGGFGGSVTSHGGSGSS